MEMQGGSQASARAAIDSEISPTESILSVQQLALKRLGKTFARVPDFSVSSGEIVALVGASGSGKTTALMALAAIWRPTRGKIRIRGQDPWALHARGRDYFRGRHIGLIFQTFHLVDALSVSANIQLAGECVGRHQKTIGRLDMLLDRLGIAPLRNRRADRISHGQAQRVAVARALFNQPAIVLADEPTSALDDANADALLSLLKECAVAEKAALVIATHDRRVLTKVDRVVEMEAL